MFIVPINSTITPLNILSQQETSVSNEEAKREGSFASIFSQLINNVEETNRVSEEDSLKVSLGEIDDLHTVAINAEKAALAMEVFVSVKNTAVDAYKEIIQMNI